MVQQLLVDSTPRSDADVWGGKRTTVQQENHLFNDQAAKWSPETRTQLIYQERAYMFTFDTSPLISYSVLYTRGLRVPIDCYLTTNITNQTGACQSPSSC